MKINGKIVETNGYFAYDNCHKIYVCETDEDIEDARKCGYSIYNIDELEIAYEYSCPLRFIRNWNLTTCYVPQFENAEFSKNF